MQVQQRSKRFVSARIDRLGTYALVTLVGATSRSIGKARRSLQELLAWVRQQDEGNLDALTEDETFRVAGRRAGRGPSRVPLQ